MAVCPDTWQTPVKYSVSPKRSEGNCSKGTNTARCPWAALHCPLFWCSWKVFKYGHSTQLCGTTQSLCCHWAHWVFVLPLSFSGEGFMEGEERNGLKIFWSSICCFCHFCTIETRCTPWETSTGVTCLKASPHPAEQKRGCCASALHWRSGCVWLQGFLCEMVL